MERDAGTGPGRALGLFISALRLGDSFDMFSVSCQCINVLWIGVLLLKDGPAPEVTPITQPENVRVYQFLLGLNPGNAGIILLEYLADRRCQR